MTSVHIPVATLLEAHRIESDLTHDQLVARVEGAPGIPAGWAPRLVSGATALSPRQLRSLIIHVNPRRELATEHIDPVALLAALWSPAVGDALLVTPRGEAMSLEDLASKLGVSTATTRRWTRAHTAPRVERLRSALETLSLSAAELLKLADWPPAELPVGERPAFALWLVRLREARGIAQSAFARALDVQQSLYNAWENGRTYPTSQSWQRLSENFAELGIEISTEQLLLLQLPEASSATPTSSAFAQLVGRAREDRRLSRSALAHLVGVSRHAVSSWERGVTLPTAGECDPLATALEVDLGAMRDLRDQAAEAELEVRTEAWLDKHYDGRRDRGAWIAARAGAMRLRLRDVAAEIGVHRNQASLWATGRERVPARHTFAIAAALGASPQRVVEFAADPQTNHIAYGEQLRQARLSKGLTQQSVAQSVGLRQTEISAIEKGRLRVPQTAASQLHAVLGTAA